MCGDVECWGTCGTCFFGVGADGVTDRGSGIGAFLCTSGVTLAEPPEPSDSAEDDAEDDEDDDDGEVTDIDALRVAGRTIIFFCTICDFPAGSCTFGFWVWVGGDASIVVTSCVTSNDGLTGAWGWGTLPSLVGAWTIPAIPLMSFSVAAWMSCLGDWSWHTFPMRLITERMSALAASSWDGGLLENTSFAYSSAVLVTSSAMRLRAWRSCTFAIFARNSLAALSRSPTSPVAAAASSPSFLYGCGLVGVGLACGGVGGAGCGECDVFVFMFLFLSFLSLFSFFLFSFYTFLFLFFFGTF